jgi:hypothetical protein
MVNLKKSFKKNPFAPYIYTGKTIPFSIGPFEMNQHCWLFNNYVVSNIGRIGTPLKEVKNYEESILYVLRLEPFVQ